MILFLISSLSLFIPAWILASYLLKDRPLYSALFYLTLVLFSLSSIELILGISKHLTPLTLTLTSFLFGTLITGLSIYLRKKKIKISSPQESVYFVTPKGRIILISFIVILILPFLPLIRDMFLQILLVHPLSWDVVTYHLVNVLDYIQTGSLWTLRNTFNQYPGGNELIQIFSFTPLKLDTLLALNTATIGLGFLLVSALILNQVLNITSPLIMGIATFTLWGVFLAIPDVQIILFDYGRNDLTLGFWELVVLWGLLQIITEKNHRSFWLIYTGLSLGIAMGIKPNGLYYTTGVILFILSPIFPSGNLQSPYLSRIKDSLKLLIPALLMGSFWYIRNLLAYGKLFGGNLVDSAFEHSLFNELFNPQLYNLSSSLVVFLIILITISLSSLTLAILYKKLSPQIRVLISFSLIALISFLVTPNVSGYPAGATWFYKVQMRFGITLIPLCIILILTALLKLAKNYKNRFNWQQLKNKYEVLSIPFSSFNFLAGINTLGLILLLIQLFTYKPPVGLPGFNQILFVGNNPPSKVYEWVQKNITNSSIYGVGLRPYGLYNFPFSNQVTMTDSSAGWTLKEGLTLIKENHPQYLAISRDPFLGTFPQDILILAQNPDIFQPLYQDNMAIVFKITEKIKDISP